MPLALPDPSRPQHRLPAAVDDQSCPGCGHIEGVEQTSHTPRVAAWSCTACGMDWAISVVNPHLRSACLADLGAAVEEIGRLRWVLRQIIALADIAPTITNEQLRDLLVALAASGTQ